MSRKNENQHFQSTVRNRCPRMYYRIVILKKFEKTTRNFLSTKLDCRNFLENFMSFIQ